MHSTPKSPAVINNVDKMLPKRLTNGKDKEEPSTEVELLPEQLSDNRTEQDQICSVASRGLGFACQHA